MSPDFLRAAASYYGMNPDTTATDWQNDGGAMLFTFSIHATEDDMAGILQRMKVMREEEAQRQPEPESNQWSSEDVAQCRAEYDAMAPAQKSQFGSYARYHAYRMMGNAAPVAAADASLNRKVEHINAPEDSEPVSMDAVWLEAKDCTQAQMMHASDVDLRSGRHLVQWAMLTEEQKAQVADRSGGLPG